jgi:hypothetical protein
MAALERGEITTAITLTRLCLDEARNMVTDAQAARHEATVLTVRAQQNMSEVQAATERATLLRAQAEAELAAVRHERMLLTELRRAAAAGDEGAAKPTATESRPRPDALPVISDHDPALHPDPSAADSPTEFMALLRQYKIWAGNPSYRQIAGKTGQRYTRSALQQALTADRLPRKLELVDAIVAGCGGADEDRRQWASAWRRLAMCPESGVPKGQLIEFPAGANQSAEPA